MNLTSIIRTGFSETELIWIIIAFVIGVFSIILFIRRRYKMSLLMLTASGLILRILIGGIDPFLSTWDEQFHALVAKNMMTDWFKPMLIRNPVLDYDYQNWTANHIWLHKPPWFLWQISLFFTLFGVNELVLRMPTILMMTLLIPIIFRIGKLISTEHIAWYGAFLYTYSFFFIHFVSGALFTDHNDSATIFYISLSIWAWLEYTRNNKRIWVIWIGLFAGIAILNKWLVGLLVYFGWFVSLIIHLRGTEWKKELANFGMALLITIIVALPWQLYSWIRFPQEYWYVFHFNNGRHFFEALDGHAENRWYYFYLLMQEYGGLLVVFIILPGLYWFTRSIRSKKHKTAILSYLVITYLFFTLTATKMPMYCTIVTPFIFLPLGAFVEKGIEWFITWIPARFTTISVIMVLCFVAYWNLDIHKLDNFHSNKNPFWKEKKAITTKFKNVIRELKPGYDVFFNCKGYEAIIFVFYSGITAYGHYPSEEQYLMLKTKKIRMATFQDQNIPAYLYNDPEVLKIPL